MGNLNSNCVQQLSVGTRANASVVFHIKRPQSWLVERRQRELISLSLHKQRKESGNGTF